MRKLFSTTAVLSISALIIALSVAYYIFIYLPHKEKIRQQFDFKQIDLQEKKIDREIRADEQKENAKSDEQLAIQECQGENPPLDSEKLALFKSEAFKAGYSQFEIDSYIQSKEGDRERAFRDCLRGKGYLGN